jgi:SAM-dependent methyltransferase
VFSKTTELYDLIYSEFKDFQGEARRVAALIRDRCPGARSILDVGCGTGRHAETLVQEFGFQVDGLDIEPGFVEIASARCPGGVCTLGDMADFDLGKTYDVVLCLFSSIGYVKTLERLGSAARAFRRHLSIGGMVLVEPWFTPEEFHAGRLYLQTVDREDLKIARMSHSRVEGRMSRLEFHYLVGDSDGLRRLEEVHELGLFTTEEMTEALREAGFTEVEFDSQGLTGRGLFLAGMTPWGKDSDEVLL